MVGESTSNALCHLIRHALWDEPIDISLFENGGFGWKEILTLAEKHSILGLIADGVLSLPESIGPNQRQRLLLLSFHQQCFLRNQQINEKLIEVIDKLSEAEVHPLLLKGQGVSLCYPHPLLRTSGDIDLYPKSSQFEQTVQLLSQYGRCEDPDPNNWGDACKHVVIEFGDIEVEVHKHPEHSQFGAQSDVALQRIIGYWMRPEKAISVSVQGRKVFVPHPQFNVIYLFLHYFNHLYFIGIGLRQVCDWMMALHYYKGQYDVKQLEADLRAIGYYHPWQHMATIAVKYLGADPESMPFALKESQVGEELFERILEGGNFGIFLPEESESHFRRTVAFYRRWLHYSLIIRGGKLTDNLEVIRRVVLHIITRQKQRI